MDNTISGKALLTSIYTLTPTHCGTGQTTSAVDLPIAREMHTGMPVLPASSLKGAARSHHRQLLGDLGDPGNELLKSWFGPDTSDEDKAAGSIIFTEARLLLYPARSLNRVFMYVVSPLVLERLQRDLRAFNVPCPLPPDPPLLQSGQVITADRALDGKTLVLEDLVFPGDRVAFSDWVVNLGIQLSEFLPTSEKDTRNRVAANLVLVDDAAFLELLGHAIPVQARIKLNQRKTTSRDGDDRGNLWYEEYLPADCLFTCFMMERMDAIDSKAGFDGFDTTFFNNGNSCVLQLGGNETVGQGMCWWTRNARGLGIQATLGTKGAPESTASPLPLRAAGPSEPARRFAWERQRFVWGRVQQWNERPWRKEVTQRLKGLPIQLRQQGLGVTLADLMRQGGPSREMADMLAEWLLVEAPVKLVPAWKDESRASVDSLLEISLGANRETWLALQAEAGALLDQAKGLADALIGQREKR